MGDNSRKPSADQADKSKEAQKPKDTSKSTDVPKNKGGVDRSKRPTTQPGRPAVGKPNSDNGSGKTKGSGADSGSKALGEAKNSHLDRCHATPRLSGDGRQRPPDRGDRIWNPFEQPGDRAKQGDGVRYVPVVERIDIGSFRDPIIRPDGFVPQREPDPEAGYNFDTYIQVAGNKGRLIPAKHIGGTRYQVLMGTPCQPGCHLGRGKEIDLRGKHPVMAVLEAFQTARSFAGPGMRARVSRKVVPAGERAGWCRSALGC